MASIDETLLINKDMPKTWKCPHCGHVNVTGRYASSILLRYSKYLENCENCSFVHCWLLELTDDFKLKVLDMLRKEAGADHEDI